jgi:putative transposon-encoded protein
LSAFKFNIAKHLIGKRLYVIVVSQIVVNTY